MKTRVRVLLGALLTTGAAGCSFAVAAWITARCCVPENSGLAAAAIIIGYALLAAGAAAVAALVAAWGLPPRVLVRVTVPIAALGGLVIASLAVTVVMARLETDAQLQQAYENLPAFRLTLVLERADPQPFRHIEFDWHGRSYRVGDGERTCTVGLSGPQAVMLLSALRSVEGIMLDEPLPCAGTPGAVAHHMEFSIEESLPPDTEGRLAVTAACLNAHPALAAPLDAAIRIHRDDGWPDSGACRTALH